MNNKPSLLNDPKFYILSDNFTIQRSILEDMREFKMDLNIREITFTRIISTLRSHFSSVNYRNTYEIELTPKEIKLTYNLGIGTDEEIIKESDFLVQGGFIKSYHFKLRRYTCVLEKTDKHHILEFKGNKKEFTWIILLCLTCQKFIKFPKYMKYMILKFYFTF